MTRLRIACYMTVIVLVIQLAVLIFESKKLQVMPGKVQNSRRVIGGHILPDSTGAFFMRRFFKSEGYPINSIEPNDITLATHCTVDFLHHIIDLVEVWDGPISIAIFTPGDDAAFAEDVIDGLRLCWPKLRQKATFHLLYPRDKTFQANMTRVGSFAYYSCKDITRKMYQRNRAFISMLNKGIEFNQLLLRYPHNILRNMAIDGAITDYIFSVDIDLIPSKNLREGFLSFARDRDLSLHKEFNKIKGNTARTKYSVYVVPAFEAKESESSLRFKNDIIQSVKESQIRILLQETCSQCHHPTNYDKWYETAANGNNISVSHEGVFTPGWEPYFIARRDTPRFDTNMVRYGYDRLSQICELHAKQYSFLVLDNAYLIRQRFTTVQNMPKEANLRKEDAVRFHRLFRQRLGQSGKLAKSAIVSC